MSYSPGIPYRGPDAATLSMTRELTARFDAPPRPYEFVTGWKDPLNVSGHNPDANGITHGVDIFCAPARNRWIADHLAARGRAGDKRVLYVIYAGQLANDRTGWQFAGEGWEHWDHVHLSVWDGYWGGPCTLPASIYNDASSWGISTLAGQGSGITPIQEDDEMTPAQMLELKQFIQEDNEARHLATRATITAKELTYGDKIFIQTAVESRAVVTRDVVKTAVATLATYTPGIDSAKLEAALQDAVAKAVAEGLAAGVKVDATVSVEGGSK